MFMKLLILGASGGCGKWLVQLAHERGHLVRVIVRPTTLTDGAPVGSVINTDYYGLFTNITRGTVAKWILDTVEQPGPFKDHGPMICSKKNGSVV